jgi:spermidine/putrescine transport system substrate-binding protein
VNRLRLLTWPAYINPLTLRQFESEYGVPVELEIVPSAADLVARMRSSGPAVDVLCPPDYAVRELHALNRLHHLDRARLPNLMHLEAHFRYGRRHDPEGLLSVVKDWGTTGYMYRTDRLHQEPRSWADFWELAEEFSGSVTVLDSPAEVIGAALKMRGRSYNASAAEDLAEARSDLLRLKPHLLAFETDYKPLLAAGKAFLALGWNGDAAALKEQGIPIQYVVPSEGSQLWEDDWAIAANAPALDAAYLFLDFVLRPEVAAQEARYTRYATANRAARALLEDELQHDSSIYPSDEVLANLEAGQPLDEPAQARRDQLWREIRG